MISIASLRSMMSTQYESAAVDVSEMTADFDDQEMVDFDQFVFIVCGAKRLKL